MDEIKPMRPEIKAKWIARLRSPDAKQTNGRLRRLTIGEEGKPFTYEGDCCLGVLCQLHSEEKGIEWKCGNYMGQAAILPDEVVQWAGLDSNNPALGFDDKLVDQLAGGLVTAIAANDTFKESFAQIADRIEKAL